MAQLPPANRKSILNQEKQEVNNKSIVSMVTVFCSDNFIPNYASKDLSIKEPHMCKMKELSPTSNRKHTE
jgi:hypothetical protein